MKFSLFLAALLFVNPAAHATPSPGDTREAEILGELCDEGFTRACRKLAKVTNGNCAAPRGLGCRYDSNLFVPMDYGLMLEVPGIGYSRVETLNFCLGIAKVDKFQDLITDWQFVTFEGCMKEHT